jgi:hypothetical protein
MTSERMAGMLSLPLLLERLTRGSCVQYGVLVPIFAHLLPFRDRGF